MSFSESNTSLDRQAGKNTGLVSFKTGVVEEAKVGWAIIRFPDLGGLLSKWLPVLHMKTQDDKVFWTLDVGEQVQCLMDDRLEDGCILGAIYSQLDVPPTDDKDEFGVVFKDGGGIRYNRRTGVATVKAIEKVILDTPTVHATGDIHADGDVTAGDISLRQHIHLIITPVPGTPVTPPVD